MSPDGWEAMNAAGDAEEMTLEQTAGLLGLSPRVIRRWAEEGRIPSRLTTGGEFRFPSADVEAMAHRLKGDS